MARNEQFETVAIPKRVQLAGAFETRDSTFIKAVRVVNGYAERIGQGEYCIYKRQGMSAAGFTGPGGTGKGVYFFETFPGVGFLISIVGNSVYSHNLTTLAGTLIGSTVVGPANLNNFVLVPSVSGNRLVFGDGTTAYFTDGATVTQLLLANNFPSGTNSFFRGWAYLNGYLYVFVNLNEIRGTANLDDPVTWDLLSSIQARTEPDYGKFLAKHHNYVCAIKQWTTDFFYDAGNPSGSPLKYVQGATLPYGTVHAGSVQDFDGMLLWVSNNRSSGPQVLLLNRMQPQIVSSPSVERLLREASWDTFYSQVFRIGGHRLYVISTLNTNFTLAYDLDERLWYQWSSPTGTRWGPVQSTYVPGVNARWKYVVQDLSGNLFFSEEASFITNDAGVVAPVDIYTIDYDAGTKRVKTLGAMLFDVDKLPGVLKVRHNDDDRDPSGWTNFQEVDLNSSEPALRDCGSFVSRSWNFRYEGNTDFRMKTVDLQIDIGTN